MVGKGIMTKQTKNIYREVLAEVLIRLDKPNLFKVIDYLVEQDLAHVGFWKHDPGLYINGDNIGMPVGYPICTHGYIKEYIRTKADILSTNPQLT